jgi:hypothetical protein
MLFSARPPPITCAGSWSPGPRAGRVPAAPSWRRRCAGSVRPRRGGSSDVRGRPPRCRAASGARVFYERLGFTPAEAAAPGPEGGSRQVYRKTVT